MKSCLKACESRAFGAPVEAIFSEHAGVKKAWLQKCRTTDESGVRALKLPLCGLSGGSTHEYSSCRLHPVGLEPCMQSGMYLLVNLYTRNAKDAFKR